MSKAKKEGKPKKNRGNLVKRLNMIKKKRRIVKTIQIIKKPSEKVVFYFLRYL